MARLQKLDFSLRALEVGVGVKKNNGKSLRRENKSTSALQNQAGSRKFPGACGSPLPDLWAQAYDCQASPKLSGLLL